MIGIIGGNGVAATNKLLSLVEEQLTKLGAFRDVHHPEMVIWQATNAPSRSMYLEGRGPSWIEHYITIGKQLMKCGCSEIAMCCNTAHYAIDDLEKKIGVRFINLLNLVASHCCESSATKVGIMCTDGLRKYGLYNSYFEKFSSKIKVVYPNDSMQKIVTLGICNAKNSIRYTNPADVVEHPYNCFSKVCEYLLKIERVDCIVAGCTDICSVFNPYLEFPEINYVDSLCVLANYIVERYNKNF